MIIIHSWIYRIGSPHTFSILFAIPWMVLLFSFFTGKTTLFRKRSNENESISSVSKSRSSRVGFLGLVRAADDMVTARYGNVSRRDSSLLVSSEVGVALPTVLFAARAHRRAY